MKSIGQCSGNNETPRLYTNYKVDMSVMKMLSNLVNGQMEGLTVCQQWGNVFEDDPLFREIWNVSDFMF
jgi:hypothetical protein